MMRLPKDERGFTFLEMSIVVAIIAILLLIAVPNYQKATARAQEKSCELTRNMMQTQIQNYYIDKGSYTNDLDTLKNEGYLKDKPKCPSGGTYTITTPTDAAPDLSVTCSEHPVTP